MINQKFERGKCKVWQGSNWKQQVYRYVGYCHQQHTHIKLEATCHFWRIIAMFCEKRNVEERLKYLAMIILQCPGCKRNYIDRIMKLMMIHACSAETVLWWLKQGANPNTKSGKLYVDGDTIKEEYEELTMMALGALYSKRRRFDPEVFYWLVLYGGDVVIANGDESRRNYNYESVMDILEGRRRKLKTKSENVFDEGKGENVFGEVEEENILETGETEEERQHKMELKRGVNRMKQEVARYCLILQPLLDITFSYLLWPK